MKWIPVSLATLLFASGCATLKQRVENVRNTETILFDGMAQSGIILNSGDRISWDSATPVPVIATPTTFYYGASSMAYTQVEKVEVVAFEAAKELFLKAITYEDLLVVDQGANRKRVFLLVPETDKKNRTFNPSERKALAMQLADVLESRRESVDIFGQIPEARSLGIGTNPGLSFHTWWQAPHYLDLRYREERQAVDSLFKSSRKGITETFGQGIRPSVIKSHSIGSLFTLIDAGEVKLDWSHNKPILRCLSEGDDKLRSIIIVDTIRIFLEEKIDPSGAPNIQAKFTSSIRFYDLDQTRMAEYRTFDHTTTWPLSTLLDEGQPALIAETRIAMDEIARKLHQALNGNQS